MSNNTIVSKYLPALTFDKNRLKIKHCPCGKDNKDGKFAPYLGFDDKGYCHSCDKNFLPELTNGNQQPLQQFRQASKPLPIIKPIDYIPVGLYQKIINDGIDLYDHNNFIQWLINPNRGEYAFDILMVNSIIETYFLGNWNNEWYTGWIIFPYINIAGILTDVKAIDYNPETGKRIKEPYPKCHFIGKKILNNNEANTTRCFFGEHLLKDNRKPVMLFESEATAIYASVFYPDFICLATGGKNGCKWTAPDKCKVLHGRHITLYPDIDAHNEWEDKADILRYYGIRVNVSQLIKNCALQYASEHEISYTELARGKFDLRDILMFKNVYDFLFADATIKFEAWKAINPNGGRFNYKDQSFLINPKQ